MSKNHLKTGLLKYILKYGSVKLYRTGPWTQYYETILRGESENSRFRLKCCKYSKFPQKFMKWLRKVCWFEFDLGILRGFRS